jgi:hypothetical protein
MGHFLKLKYAQVPVGILASTSIPFRSTTVQVQMSNLEETDYSELDP